MKRILRIVKRELRILRSNPIYFMFMVVMPIVAVLFFTTILSGGQPTEMPVGIVDQDYTPITRRMARLLDAFQTTRIAGQYATVSDARRAVQRGGQL